MARIQKYKFVEKNISMLRMLTKEGYVSPKLLSYYNIYLNYISIKNKQKMNKYEITAQETGNSIITVRRAVYDMKSYVTT